MGQKHPDIKFPSIQFVDCSAKLTNGAATRQKTAKSHAARYGHAKARREQQLRNQAARDAAENNAAEMIKHEASQSPQSDGPLWVSSASPTAATANASMLSLRKNVYAAFDMEINQFESLLLSHYVNIVVPFGTRQCSRITQSKEWVDSMRTEFVPVALSKSSILAGILMTACRDLFKRRHAPQHSELATVYKLSCISGLQSIMRLTNRPINTDVIIITALLAEDEFALGDRSASKKHIEAVEKMAAMVGFENLGMNGFLLSFLTTLSCAEKSANIYTCR